MNYFLLSGRILFSSLMIPHTLTQMRTIWFILESTLLPNSNTALRLLSPSLFSVTETSEARPTDLQLQAVHREVFSPHHTGRSDIKRKRSCSLPADCEEHQREVRQPTHLPRMLELLGLANQGLAGSRG